MPIFLKQGDKFKVSTSTALDLHERLPVGTYTVGIECDGGLFLQTIDNFSIAHKLYGDTVRHTDRILRTFLDRANTSTGVLLSGEKGSGKTLLAKQIAIEAAARHGIPTIVINRNLHGEDFNAFIQLIDQPTVILFDEFEKVYQEMHEQEAMLTLLDGVYPSRKLFILTCNDKYRVDSHMMNRPGRIYYMLDFSGLTAKFIKEYCQDNLTAKEHIPGIVAVSAMFEAFNFDMLQSMVEEMNRYDESPSEVLEFLNVRPEFGENMNYRIQLSINGKELSEKNDLTMEWHGNPLTEPVSVYYRMDPVPHDNAEDEDNQDMCESTYKETKFTTKDLKSMDGNKGVYVFGTATQDFGRNNKLHLVLTRDKPARLDFATLMACKPAVSETSSQTDAESVTATSGSMDGN